MAEKNSQIFLTGVTGVLGSHLLKEILESTKSKIYCLVRGDDALSVRNRALNFLRAYDPQLQLRGEFDERVTVIAGDVSLPYFGLSQEHHDRLTETTDVTIHAAALTNLFLSYPRVKKINVDGTENVIKFSLKTKKKYLCYVSTHTIMGNSSFDPKLIFKETDLDIGQSFDHMSYQKSKFVAENMIRKAGEEDGLLWNIFRPGQIFGDSRTGFYPQGQTNVGGLFYDIFKTVIETGVSIISKTHFDVAPVDYVSRGIICLGLDQSTYFKTYHLTNPDIKGYSDVVKVVSEEGYPIRFVTEAQYKKMLFAKELSFQGREYKSSTTSAFRWWYKREIFSFEDGCVTDCKMTNDLLKSYGIHCPPIGTDLIGKYVDEAVRWNFFPAPVSVTKPRRSSPDVLKEQRV